MVIGEQEFEGQQPAFGVMGLREQQVARAAELAGVTEIEAKFVGAANIRAAAALLDELAEGRTFDRKSIGAWAPVVAAYSGIEDLEGQANYVHTEVYEAVRNGIEIQTLDGVMAAMSGVDIQPDFQAPTPPPQAAQGPDYSKAPSGAPRPTTGHPARAAPPARSRMVIIHTCEGAYSGCWGWLVNTQSGVSAHYVVKEDRLRDLPARQASRKQAPTTSPPSTSELERRQGARPPQRHSSNNFTVGIEHAGFANQNSWHANLIEQSAKLTCDIAKRNGIARDKYHIVGHGQLQPNNRIDPGPNWPWATYLSKVQSYCGDIPADPMNPPPPPPDEPDPMPPPDDPPPDDPPPPPSDPAEIIVDSNQGNNNAALRQGHRVRQLDLDRLDPRLLRQQLPVRQHRGHLRRRQLRVLPEHRRQPQGRDLVHRRRQPLGRRPGRRVQRQQGANLGTVKINRADRRQGVEGRRHLQLHRRLEQDRRVPLDRHRLRRHRRRHPHHQVAPTHHAAPQPHRCGAFVVPRSAPQRPLAFAPTRARTSRLGVCPSSRTKRWSS
jgi:hypothetical protein